MLTRRTQSTTDDNEDLARPVVTYAILAIIWVVFFAMAAASHWRFSSFPDSIADIFGDKQNDRIMAGGHLLQWWRIITPIFLHGGLLHICVNSYSLYLMGRQLEPFYGSRRYFVIFMVAGVAGVLASLRFSPHPSLGASGALFGLVGAGIVFPIRFKALVPAAQGRRIVIQLAKVAAVNLLIGFSLRQYVDNSAHIGGMLGGGLAALFLIPDALDARTKRGPSNSMLWIACGAFILLIVFSAAAQARWALGPWWRVSIPKSFQAVYRVRKFEGEWRSADGSSVEITDTVHNPNLLPGALYMLKRTDIPSNWRRVGGAIGRVHVLHNEQDMIEVYLILVYGRVFIVTMHTTTDKYDTERPNFATIIQSIQFLHPPPPDLNPVSIATHPGDPANKAVPPAGE